MQYCNMQYKASIFKFLKWTSDGLKMDQIRSHWVTQVTVKVIRGGWTVSCFWFEGELNLVRMGP